MNLAALFSGGKDSTYAIHAAQKMGHSVKCLVTILTISADSHLLHHQNIGLTALQAKSMGIPQILAISDSAETEKEVGLLRSSLQKARDEYKIDGVVHGGILSEFQKKNFEKIASDLNLQVISPIWKSDQAKYMDDLLEGGFEFVISSVSCDGLDDSWLGKKITRDDLAVLKKLAEKHGFNLSFEGGEAETFVTNCPLFSSPIKILESSKEWDGYRGIFEITQARINSDA